MNPTLYKWIKGILIGAIVLIIAFLVTGYVLLITHKKEIHTLLTSTFSDKMSGDLVMKDMDYTVFERFPHFTIRIEKVFVADSASAIRGDTVITTKKIAIGVNLLHLFRGAIQFNSISISDASIYMVKDSSGQMNIPKARQAPPATKEKKEVSIPGITTIILDNVSFHLTDSLKGKKFGLTFKKAEFNTVAGNAPMSYHMDASIHFDGLVFNPSKGGYLTDQDIKLDTYIGFDPDNALLSVKNGLLNMKNEILLININMNFKEQTMHMTFSASSITPAIAFGALTPAIQEKLKPFQLEKPVIAHVVVDGSIKPGSKPAVDVYFKSTGNKLNAGVRSFDNLYLLGWFTTHMDSTKINDDHNSRVMIPAFNGTYFGLPIIASVTVTDLMEPVMRMKAHLSYDKTKHGEVITPNLKFLDGSFDVRYTFHGPLTNFVDSVNKVTIGDLYGSAVFSNTDFNNLANGYEFRNVEGNITFKKPDLWIESLSMRLNGNKMSMTGSAKYFIAFLLIPGVKTYATLDLTADTIDFNAFQSAPSARNEKKKVDTDSKKADIPGLINWISTSVELDINVSAKKVIVNRFFCSFIKANLLLTNNRLQINDAAMKTSGGNFLLNLSIDNLSGSQHALNAKTSIKEVSMSDLLYSFNNFNQTTITDQNISGTLTTNATFAATIDQNYEVIGSSMTGSVRTRVKNGQLKNVDGLDKISKYIFKNRDFNNIDFADIDNRSKLTGTVFDIDTLNIFSSVLTLFISGIYDFNKITTDMLITVPLINLKKMDAAERMALTDSAAMKGGNVMLRATHAKDGDLNVLPVVLGKDKKKEKEQKTSQK